MILDSLPGQMTDKYKSRLKKFLMGDYVQSELKWNEKQVDKFIKISTDVLDVLSDIATVVISIFSLRFFYQRYGFEWMVLFLLMGANFLLFKILNKKVNS